MDEKLLSEMDPTERRIQRAKEAIAHSDAINGWLNHIIGGNEATRLAAVDSIPQYVTLLVRSLIRAAEEAEEAELRAARLSDAMAAGPINHLSDEADAQVVIDKTRSVVEAVNAEMYHLRKAIEDGDEPEDVTARLNDADEAIAYALCHLEDVTSDYTSEPDGY